MENKEHLSNESRVVLDESYFISFVIVFLLILIFFCIVSIRIYRSDIPTLKQSLYSVLFTPTFKEWKYTIIFMVLLTVANTILVMCFMVYSSIFVQIYNANSVNPIRDYVDHEDPVICLFMFALPFAFAGMMEQMYTRWYSQYLSQDSKLSNRQRVLLVVSARMAHGIVEFVGKVLLNPVMSTVSRNQFIFILICRISWMYVHPYHGYHIATKAKPIYMPFVCHFAYNFFITFISIFLV